MSLSLPPAMLDTLTEQDYDLLSLHQRDRLRHHFPAELTDAVIETGLDTTLIIACDWETIRLLDEDWDSFAHFVYVITGCDRTSFYVNDEAVLTQHRAIECRQSASVNEAAMVATAERTGKQEKALQRMTTAAEEAVAAKPRRAINEIVQELADEIALRAIARIEASAVMVNQGYREQANGAAEAVEPEQAPIIESATPTLLPLDQLPKVRLAGFFSPAKSNYIQTAKRYLKAADPKGNGGIVLKHILDRTARGQANLERAVREYPEADRDKARRGLYNGFQKVAEERMSKD